ncbi:type II secretion system protein GspG [Thiohalorhabdus sp.]|uniref:type II secretion system protein GspG n=1 Tax=Thiohalorhabdus sp. TaxID=3094134 RepID=UPI002FC3A205
MERLKGRSHQSRALEWGVVLLFILALVWVVLNRYGALEERAVATLARYEHQLLQTRIQVYRLRNGDWPAELQEALSGDPSEVLMTGQNPRRDRLVDKQGRLIDPFGQPYRYDPETGALKMPEKLARQRAPD